MPLKTACKSSAGLDGFAAGRAVNPVLPHQDQGIREQVERHRQPAPLQPHHELMLLKLGPLLVEHIHVPSLIKP